MIDREHISIVWTLPKNIAGVLTEPRKAKPRQTEFVPVQFTVLYLYILHFVHDCPIFFLLAEALADNQTCKEKLLETCKKYIYTCIHYTLIVM